MKNGRGNHAKFHIRQEDISLKSSDAPPAAVPMQSEEENDPGNTHSVNTPPRVQFSTGGHIAR